MFCSLAFCYANYVTHIALHIKHVTVSYLRKYTLQHYLQVGEFIVTSAARLTDDKFLDA